MIAGIIEGATRFIGAPADTDQGDGTFAASLYVRDGNIQGFPTVEIAWFPSDAEYQLLRDGRPIHVKVVCDPRAIPAMVVSVPE